MALLFADPGGKYYATSAQAVQGLYVGGNFNVVTSGLPAGNIESTAIAETGLPCAVVPVPNTSGPYTLGLRLLINPLPSNNTVLQFNDATGNAQILLNVLSNGGIQVQRGGTVLGATGPSIIFPNVWNYIEFQGFCSSTVGTVAVRVNNSTVLNLTGVNTQNQSTAIIGQASVLDKITNAQDIYVTDNTTPVGNTAVGFLGDVSMATLHANRNGTFTAYTANGAASLWQCVADLTPDDATTFVSDSTVNDRVSFGYASVATSNPIVGVVHVSRCAKSDSGARTFSQTLTSNGVDSIATAVSPGTTYAYSTQVLTIDPNTGQAWTVNGVNALQGGIKTVS